MNTEKMRQIAMLMHLTVHKIGFHLKFPATLSLELEIDRKTSCIVDGISLGKDTIAVNKQARFESALNYDESTKSYESKKATILICIKTKTSENKLTAGVVPLQFSGPNQHLTNITARPLRCNDPKAFIEYSLRTETLRKPTPSPDQTLSTHAGEMQQTARTIFKSAVHYNNNRWGDGEDPETAQSGSRNELDKYLSAPFKGDQRKRYKSSGKLPLNSMQNCEEDSRTEIMSSRKEVGKECSIVSSRHNSIEKQAKQLSKRSEAISKEISEARLIQQTLKAQNKNLKARISKYEEELDEQSSQMVALNKRYEVREDASGAEAKQLKAKLSESESQLHQLLLEKNQFLNQMEAKQKETLAVLKQKEKTANEEKRKLLMELQLRKQQKESISNDNSQLQDSLNHSQRMITDLMNQVGAKEKEYLKLQKALEDVKLQMLEKLNTLQGLQTEVCDKGKAVEDLKLQKKLIYEIRQERDGKDIALAQSATTIKELQLAIAEKDDLLRKKASLAEIANQENEALKNQLKQEATRQGELASKLKEYEAELKRSADNSGRITKQIKDVESELKGIKRQANSEASDKTRLVGDYEGIIASLQERAAALLEEKEEQEYAIADLNALHRQKEEECYDLGQQLITSKDEVANLANELELLREENNYMNKCLQELAEKEERLLRAEEKLQYNERLYEELQQKHELQRIQLQNEIGGLQQRGEEKTDALRAISEQLRKAEQEQLQLQDQIQTLGIGLANRTTELNFLRMENDRNRDTTIQFEQRMALLRRTEETATSTLDEIREENDALRRVVHQNSQAMTLLGKRYDSLYRSTVQSLTQLLEMVRSERSMANSSVKHEKAEISSLLNDCIRYIGAERENAAVYACKMGKALEEESAANRENVKIIRLKAQMQKELEDEMQVMRAFEESLQANITKLSRDIDNNLQTIRQKEGAIADLHADIASLRRDHATALARKDDTIQRGTKEVDRLNHQIDIDAEKYNASVEKAKLAMANLEADLQAKISGLNATVSELGGELKSERETSRQQTAKISELESTNAKITKQKQEVSLDLERRTGELIASRLECENRSKSVLAKEAEATSLQKSIDKLSCEKSSLQSQLQQREGTLKEISMKKGECEATLKERNNEILLLKMRIDEAEDAKNKLVQQRQELIKGKGIQQTLVSTLNQSIKAFKDAAILTEDRIKKLSFEKECTEKENSKKLNITANEKATLERQLNELKLRAAQKESDFAAKERALQEELKSSKAKVGEHSSLILDLRREVEAGNAKMDSLMGDFNAKTAELQSKEKSLLPSAGKLKEVMQSISELRAIGKEYEASKAKLLRLTNSARLGQQDYERTCEVARELGIAINKVKIQVLNRLGLPTEVKTALLEGLKGLQAVAEKLNRG